MAVAGVVILTAIAVDAATEEITDDKGTVSIVFAVETLVRAVIAKILLKLVEFVPTLADATTANPETEVNSKVTDIG